MGGGGIMVWGMTLPTGEIFVEKLKGKVDSDKQVKLLRYKVKPIVIVNDRFKDSKYLFQQDNCKVNVSKKTLKT